MAFKQALGDPDPNISGLAQEVLEDLGTEALSEAVADTALDRDWEVRAAALRTLEDMHEFAPLEWVAASAMTDPEPQIRMIALELLAYGDPDEAMDTIDQALDDKDPKVRELAADLLHEFEQGQQGASN